MGAREFSRHYAGTLSVLGGLGLWELASRLLVANPLFLAAPSQILAAIVSLAATGELWHHVGISGLEFLIGSRRKRNGVPAPQDEMFI